MPEKAEKISNLHGQRIEAQASYGAISIVPLFHPAVALDTASQKDVLLEDFKVLTQFVG